MSKETTNPAADEQRKVGLKLAKEFDAPETLAKIKNGDICYGEILACAAQEVGTDKLVEVILRQSPEWSFHTLRSVPHLGDARGRLEERASEWASQPSERAQESLAAQTPINNLKLGLVWGSVMYTCWFTMFWQNPDGVNQPLASYSNSGAWVWSPKMDITYHDSYAFTCSHFKLPVSPLAAGNNVWMRVQISGGGAHDIGKGSYIYDPSSGGATLSVEAGGTTLNPTFKIV